MAVYIHFSLKNKTLLEFINVLVRVSTTKNNFQRRIIKLLDREVGLGGKARDKDVLFWGFFLQLVLISEAFTEHLFSYYCRRRSWIQSSVPHGPKAHLLGRERMHRHENIRKHKQQITVQNQRFVQ